MSISTSLQTIAANGNSLWKLRDRRNIIDARIAELRVQAEALGAQRDIHGQASVMHKIGALESERIELRQRIATLSGHVIGMANATARRLA